MSKTVYKTRNVGMTTSDRTSVLAAMLRKRGDSDSIEAADELLRLQGHEQANQIWMEKTHWIQKTALVPETGMHRADAIKARVEILEKQIETLKGKQ